MSAVTLTEFLLARIEEDELKALSIFAPAIQANQWIRGLFMHTDGTVEFTDHEGTYTLTPEEWDETARRYADPRLLAECEVKRRIVELCAPLVTPDRLAWAATDRDPSPHLADDALRLLALPYAEHPDYREEWRP